MSGKIRTVFKNFDYMHCDDFAKYLGDMAAKGWYFKRWGVGLKFEMGEPRQVTYAVEVFPKASEEDVHPAPNTLEFAEYCEAAGWKFVDAKRKFCIFEKIEPDAMELFTPKERVEHVFERGILVNAIILLVLFGLNAMISWVDFFSIFEDNIFSSSALDSVFVWTVLFLSELGKMLFETWQYRKLKKKLSTGENIYIGNRQNSKWHFNASDAYKIILLLLLVCLFLQERVEVLILAVGSILVLIVVSMILDKLKLEKETNVVVLAVFSIVFVMLIMVVLIKEEVDDHSKKIVAPLMSTDYRENLEEIKDISYDGEKNILGSADEYFIYEDEESLYYKIYRSEHTWTLDKIWDEWKQKDFNEEMVDCTMEWGATKALAYQNSTYYVRYGHAILVFADSEASHLSQAQIDIIREKLELR